MQMYISKIFLYKQIQHNSDNINSQCCHNVRINIILTIIIPIKNFFYNLP
jgi:hypothetical protein